MDYRAMADYVADTLLSTCRSPLCLVFLGCGTAEHEKELTNALLRMYAVDQVCLMDKDFDTTMNANAAAIGTRCAIDVHCFASYSALTAHLTSQTDGVCILPLGINNAVSFDTFATLWEAYEFFVACEAFTVQRAPNMATSTVNFLDNSTKLYNGHSHEVLTSSVSLSRNSWWIQACELITCDGAKAVLAEKLTRKGTARILPEP